MSYAATPKCGNADPMSRVDVAARQNQPKYFA